MNFGFNPFTCELDIIGGAVGSSTPIYQYAVPAGGTNTITVPTALMTCSSGTLVCLNNSVMHYGMTRVGNVYTFDFDLNEGDIVLFKN